MLTPPTVEELATFSGKDVEDYDYDEATEALRQATLLVEISTGLTEYPSDESQAQLLTYAILETAEGILAYNENRDVVSNPFKSETIGSYSYSKSSGAGAGAGAGTGSGVGGGLYWFNLALSQLGIKGSVVGQAGTSVFDTSPPIELDRNGRRFVPGPADEHLYPDSYFNTQT